MPRQPPRALQYTQDNDLDRLLHQNYCSALVVPALLLWPCFSPLFYQSRQHLSRVSHLMVPFSILPLSSAFPLRCWVRPHNPLYYSKLIDLLSDSLPFYLLTPMANA